MGKCKRRWRVSTHTTSNWNGKTRGDRAMLRKERWNGIFSTVSSSWIWTRTPMKRLIFFYDWMKRWKPVITTISGASQPTKILQLLWPSRQRNGDGCKTYVETWQTTKKLTKYLGRQLSSSFGYEESDYSTKRTCKWTVEAILPIEMGTLRDDETWCSCCSIERITRTAITIVVSTRP